MSKTATIMVEPAPFDEGWVARLTYKKKHLEDFHVFDRKDRETHTDQETMMAAMRYADSAGFTHVRVLKTCFHLVKQTPYRIKL